MSEASKSLSDYPPLPKTHYCMGVEGDGYSQDRLYPDDKAFSEADMRDYVAADRASQASAQPPAEQLEKDNEALRLHIQRLTKQRDALADIADPIEPPVQQKGERERFESKFIGCHQYRDGGDYSMMECSSGWEAWQSALASTPHSAAPEAQSGYYKPVSVEAYRAASGVSPEPTRVGTLWKARGIDHAVTWFQDADRLIDGAHAIFVRAALAPQVAPGPGSVDPVASGGTFPDAADEENPPLDLRSAVHRLMKEHGSEKRSGPCRFTPGVFAPSGQAFIDDDDFLYDATIRVGGDFVDDKQHSYARAICDVLNAAIAASNGSRGGAHG